MSLSLTSCFGACSGVASGQAAILTLESQVSQPEALSSWCRSDRRAQWRAEVASGGVSVTSQAWLEVLSRMSEISKKGLTATWLPLVPEGGTGSTSRHDGDTVM